MRTHDKVSIIIPVYNAAKYLSKCLDSVINQSYENIEIIIINDGSTDSSSKICEKYTSRYKQIKLINQFNSGPSAARNRGISESNGKYIQFVDSDDTINPNMTQKLIESMNSNVQLIICGYKIYHLDTGKYRVSDNVPRFSGVKNNEDFFKLFGYYYEKMLINSPCNKLYLSDIINENKICFNTEVDLGEDLLFNLCYLKQCIRINIIEDNLYNYITTETGSLTRSYKKDLFKNQKLLFDNVRDFLESKNSYSKENKSIINRMYLNTITICCENILNSMNIRNNMIEINEILNDYTIIKTINDINNDNCIKLKFQSRIIKTLIEFDASYGIYFFFLIKKFVRGNFKLFFKMIKKIIIKFEKRG